MPVSRAFAVGSTPDCICDMIARARLRVTLADQAIGGAAVARTGWP
ncbi:MAG: hypothetical protein M9932_12345 [Xanthobacteraceae bacterium]|nr:hypothetical protein [Xanthobacteraceae bacterium]